MSKEEYNRGEVIEIFKGIILFILFILYFVGFIWYVCVLIDVTYYTSRNYTLPDVGFHGIGWKSQLCISALLYAISYIIVSLHFLGEELRKHLFGTILSWLFMFIAITFCGYIIGVF